MFGAGAAAQYDVNFRANVGQFRADVAGIRGAAREAYGGISTETLRAQVVQEKYDRALARTTVGSFQANRATLAYRNEMAALSAQTTRTSSSLQHEEQTFSRLGRGALAGSGALGNLRRAAVFASSAFLGGFGLAYALKAVSGAAEEEQSALTRLQTSLHNAGLSWGQYGDQIEAAVQKQERGSGFGKADISTSLAANITRFGDVRKAIEATAAAEDVARQKNISLADAQNLLQRASFGNARSARQLGIAFVASTSNLDKLRETTKHATADQVAQAKAADLAANRTALLAAIEAKYHGAAAAYLQTTAGKEQLFNATLKDTEAIIGAALLPAFTKYLGQVGNWLGKAQNQARLQRDVNTALHDSGVAIHEVTALLTPLVHEFQAVGKAVGGTEREVKLLSAAMLLFWARARLIQWGVISGGIKSVGAAAVVSEGEIAGAGGAMAKTGASAVVARGGVVALGESLTGLSGLVIAPIAIPIVVKISQQIEQGVSGKIKDVLGGTASSIYDYVEGAVTYGGIGKNPATALEHAIFGKGKKGSAKPPTGPAGPGGVTGGGPAGPSGPTPRPKAGAGTKSPSTSGYQPSGATALRDALQKAQASGNQAAIDAAAKALLAYDEQAIAFVDKRFAEGKGTPSLEQQRSNLYGDEASQRATLASGANAAASTATKAASAHFKAVETAQKKLKNRISQNALLYQTSTKKAGALTLHPAASAAAFARETKAYNDLIAYDRREAKDKSLTPLERQDETAAALATVKRRNEVAKQRDAQIAAARKREIAKLSQVPDDLKAALNLATTEQGKLRANRNELKALQDQLVVMKHLGATQAQIEKNRLDQSVVQKRINALTKKGAADGLADAHANEQQFLSEFFGFKQNYAPNAVPFGTPTKPPAGGKAETHLYEAVHELRGIKAHLGTVVKQTKFPATVRGLVSAGAVGA